MKLYTNIPNLYLLFFDLLILHNFTLDFSTIWKIKFYLFNFLLDNQFFTGYNCLTSLSFYFICPIKEDQFE